MPFLFPFFLFSGMILQPKRGKIVLNSKRQKGELLQRRRYGKKRGYAGGSDYYQSVLGA